MSSRLENKLIKAVKTNLKAGKGFVLIYNGETNKMESAFAEMCYHEVAEVLDDYLLEDDDEESEYIPIPFPAQKKIVC